MNNSTATIKFVMSALLYFGLAPFLAMQIWNKIAWEFNLPQFSMWIFEGIALLRSTLVLAKGCFGAGAEDLN